MPADSGTNQPAASDDEDLSRLLQELEETEPSLPEADPDAGEFFASPRFEDDDTMDGDDGIDETMLQEAFGDGAQASEPDPLIEVFVGGKRIRPGRIRRLWLGTGALVLTAGILVLLFAPFAAPLRMTLRGLFGGTDEPRGLLERELSSMGRLLILEAGPLGNFSPTVPAVGIARNLDIELLDEGLPVPAHRYTIETFPAPVRLVLVVEVGNLRMRELLAPLGDWLRHLRLESAGKPLAVQVYLYASVKGRAVPLGTAVPPAEAAALLSGIDPVEAGSSILIPVLEKLAGASGTNWHAVHVADRSPSDRPGFQSERLLTLLKQHRNLALYALRSGSAGADDSAGDPLAYTEANPADFSRLPASFGRFFPGHGTNGMAGLGQRIGQTASASRLRIEYRPEDTLLETGPDDRRLSLRLRPQVKALDLLALPVTLQAPNRYRRLLLAPPDLRSLSAVTNADGTASAADQALLALSGSPGRLQRDAGRIACALNAVIEAATPAGLFLLSGTAAGGPLPKPLADGVLLHQPHRLYRLQWSSNQSAAREWDARFPTAAYHKRRVGLDLDLLVDSSGLPDETGFSIDAYFGIAGDRRSPPAFPGALFSGDGRITFRRTACHVVTGVPGPGKGRPEWIPAFDLAAALERIVSSTAPGVRTPGILWTPVAFPAPGSRDPLDRLLLGYCRRLVEAGRTLVAPLPAGKPDHPGIPGLVQASGVSGTPSNPRLSETILRGNFSANRVFLAPADAPGAFPVSGNAVAAARLVPALAALLAAERPIGELASAVGLRAQLPIERGIANPGVLSPASLESLLSNRERSPLFHPGGTGSLSWQDADQLLVPVLQDRQPRLIPVPEPRPTALYRAGRILESPAMTDGSDPAGRFPFVVPANRQLALAVLGNALYLCEAAAGERGWILFSNTGFQANDAGPYIDAADELVMIGTGDGRLAFLDLSSGLPLSILPGGEPLLETDHRLGSYRFTVDTRRKRIWLIGSGSPWPTVLGYRREGRSVKLGFQADAAVHQIAILPLSHPATLSLAGRLDGPLLYPDGSAGFLLMPGNRFRLLSPDGGIP